MGVLELYLDRVWSPTYAKDFSPPTQKKKKKKKTHKQAKQTNKKKTFDLTAFF